MKVDPNDMVMFSILAEVRSFSRTARYLGISTSTVSKTVQRIESMLGVRLVNRTTRQLSLTEAGSLYYKHCAELVDIMQSAEQSIASLSSQLAGTVRVAAPIVFGEHLLGPSLVTFATRYPRLTMDILLTDDPVDLIQERLDLAVQIAPQPQRDASSIIRHLNFTMPRLCASPSYLMRYGRPKAPEDLRSHNCLQLVPQGNTWHFLAPDGKRLQVSISGSMSSNSAMTLLRAALAGLGVAFLPGFFSAPWVKAGELEVVLAEYTAEPNEIYVIMPPNHHKLPKVRVLVDFLVEQFANIDWLSAYSNMNMRTAPADKTPRKARSR